MRSHGYYEEGQLYNTHRTHYDIHTSAKGVPLPCMMQVWSCL